MYLITGATGYIGSFLAKYIMKTDVDAKIVAPVRRLEKAKLVLSEGGQLSEKVMLVEAGLSDENDMERFSEWLFSEESEEIDYILHCASTTKSSEMRSRSVEVTESIVNMTQNILKLASRYKIKSMVYLSSMEVYGSINCPDGHRAAEPEAGRGNIDLLNTRSSYPMGKRMAENICYSYYREYDVPVKIARLAQTFGSGIFPKDTRIFAQFSRAVAADEDLVLHTAGDSMGNYCGIGDTVRGILTILKYGADGEAYNVVNEENTMTIRQMAELVANQVAGGKIKVVYDIPEGNPYGYAAGTGLRLSGEKLEALGWRPEENLVEMYKAAVESIKRAVL